jgi:hypothetical protein
VTWPALSNDSHRGSRGWGLGERGADTWALHGCEVRKEGMSRWHMGRPGECCGNGMAGWVSRVRPH